tara:strand:- start:70410 stop:71096 length:687 start_codon:yes stop_codon:yes gene_type:complete
MDAQNLIADIQLNPVRYIGKKLCVYMAQVASLPMNMPKATRDAIICQWNKEYDKLYSQDTSALWVEGVKLDLVHQSHPALLDQKKGSLPVDILLNNCIKLEIDLTDNNWEQNLNNAVAEARVRAHCCKAQIQELMQNTVNALINVKLVKPAGAIALQGIGEKMMAYRKCMLLAKNAKKTIAPRVYSTFYVGFASQCNTGCEVVNARIAEIAKKAALRQALQTKNTPLS